MDKEKHIELCKMKVCDIKTGFGNPRKIKKKKIEELKRSFEMVGDFGVFVIDEGNNIIAGNQRLKVVADLYGGDALVDCKKLYGYTEEEKRFINIKDNTHAGEWDFDVLANWTADLTVDFGLADVPKKEAEERRILEMEPVAFEKYNYVLIVCRSERDYDDLTSKLGIRGKVVKVIEKRSIKARAVWYDDVHEKMFGGKQ